MQVWAVDRTAHAGLAVAEGFAGPTMAPPGDARRLKVTVLADDGVCQHIKAAASARAARGVPTSGQPQADDADEPIESEAEATSWKERIIATLTAPEFTPVQFERLAQRLLREADFESVTVTGRSGDQGPIYHDWHLHKRTPRRRRPAMVRRRWIWWTATGSVNF